MGTNETELAELTRTTFELFASGVSCTLDEGMSNESKLSLAEFCGRADLRPLLTNIRIRVANESTVPFLASGPDVLVLDTSILQIPELAVFYLRYGLELLMLERRLQDRDEHVKQTVRAILGFSLATSYLEGMIDDEKHVVQDSLPPWLMEAFSKASAAQSNSPSTGELVVIAMASIEKLRQFQVLDLSVNEAASPPNAAQEEAIRIATDLLGLACPIERILTTGGDTRLRVEKHTGLNKYGCSPRPRLSALTFSSCTASSISGIAYQEAEHSRQLLLSKGFESGFARAFDSQMQSIRQSVSGLLLPKHLRGAKVVLTPSGTDTELYALHVALGLSDRPVTGIVISSTEAGSGTELAAGGRHFDDRTPLAFDVDKGDALEGLDVERVSVEVVELRDETGSMKDPESVDKEVTELVAKAVEDGRLALLHLLDSSKTGVGGPTIGTVLGLQARFRSSLLVVADAAQMRLGRSCLSRYLENEFMVIITGSKFFTGPPFSGALLVPPKLAADISELPPFPAGLAGYATTYDFPSVWQGLAADAPGQTNVGLLLRWMAALWEMRAFHSVDPADQYSTIKTFGNAISKTIDENPDLTLVSAPLLDRGERTGPCWDQLPSIFTFLLLRKEGVPGERTRMTFDETYFVYQCLNRDISEYLPVTATKREYDLAAKPCHIGQPVRIRKTGDSWIGALRIASGARMVSSVEFDLTLGETPARRLYMQIHSARVVLEKLSTIIRYWQQLTTNVPPGIDANIH